MTDTAYIHREEGRWVARVPDPERRFNVNHCGIRVTSNADCRTVVEWCRRHHYRPVVVR